MQYTGVIRLIKRLEKSEIAWSYTGTPIKVDKLICYAISKDYQVFVGDMNPVTKITIFVNR